MAAAVEGARPVRTSSSASGEVAEARCIKPDPDKAAEVQALQEKLKGTQLLNCKEWPVLLNRLAHGTNGKPEPSDSLTLIMEVQSYMLAPIRLRAHEIGTKPVYILLGITGAGKSFTGNWMLGKKVTKKSDTVEDDSGDEEVWTLEVEDEELHVGTDRHKSATFAPNIAVNKDFVLIDYPGLGDTTGFEFRLGMDLAFRELLNDILHKKSVHVLALLPIEAFSAGGKGNGARAQLDKLRRLMPLPGCLLSHDKKATESNSCNWLIGVTKCDSHFIRNAKEEFKVAQEAVCRWVSRFQDASCSASFVASHVVNMNKLIFSKKEEEARAEFLRKLCEETHIPHTPMECLREENARAFGADVPLWCLASDCLDPDDLASLSGVIYSGDLCSGPVVEGLETPALAKEAPKLKDLDAPWSKAAAELKQALGKMKGSAAAVMADSEYLIESSHLSLERRNLVIGHLANQAQASMKQQFVRAEGNVMMDTVLTIVGQVLSLMTQVQESSCLQTSDQAKVIEKAEQVMKALQENVRELGYKDFTDLARGRNVSAMLGFGAVSCMIGHDLLLLTPAANLVAASGLVATAPFFAVVSVAGIIGAAVLGVRHMMQASWSAVFRDLLIDTFNEMLNTNEALIKHRKYLTRIDDCLNKLVVNKELP